MTRLFLTLIFTLTALVAPVSAQTLPALTYEGFYAVRTNGNDSTYMGGLTHRYVSGELRFLSLTHTGRLHEYRLPSGFGQEQTGTTAQWDLSGLNALGDHRGLWFEQAKNRLWISSGPDYTTEYIPGRVTLVQLNADGTVTRLKQFHLSVPGKRTYGGCNAVPAALVSQIGGAYVCGWGGYTSLVAQGGGASIGPTMYAIPDPDTIADGATVTVRTVLDAASTRGVRASHPVNYFDGGDPRQNPPTRPTEPPLSTAAWLSPNSDGLGWMVWGDSYYNTGMWIGTTFASVASLCQGACWYQSSTLAFDGRQFELHQWDGATLGSDPLKRPDRMTALTVPRGNAVVWGGNSPTGNLAGATYDATTGRVYAVGYPFGDTVYQGRLYQFAVGGTAPPPEPTPTPTPTPEPTPEPTPAPAPDTVTHADLKTILDRIEAALAVETFTVTVTGVSTYANGDRRLTIRVPVASMPTAPTTGSTVRVVKE